MQRGRTAILVVLLGMCLGLPLSVEPAQEPVVRISQGNDLATGDPHQTVTVTDYNVLWHIYDALTRRDALEELKPVRQLQTATARWNATTERFQRLTDGFVAEAPKPVTALTVTFGELSKSFGEAQEKKDAIGCEAALESANAALSESVTQLRAVRPDDCVWQKRVTAAF